LMAESSWSALLSTMAFASSMFFSMEKPAPMPIITLSFSVMLDLTKDPDPTGIRSSVPGATPFISSRVSRVCLVSFSERVSSSKFWLWVFIWL